VVASPNRMPPDDPAQTSAPRPFSRVLADAPVYALGEFAQAGVAILLLPVYTRMLNPSEYGAAVLCIMAGKFGAVFASLHIQAAVIRFMFDAPDDREYQQRLIGSIFAFTVAMSTGFFFVILFAIAIAYTIIGSSSNWIPYALLAALIGATSSAYEILQRILQARNEAKHYVILQALFFSLSSLVTFALLVGTDLGGISMVIGVASSTTAYYLYAVVHAQVHYGLTFDRKLLMETLAYSLRLLPNRLAGLIPRIADRLFVSAISVANAGIYSIGYRLGEGLSYISGGFFRAHLPWFYSAMAQGESGRRQIVLVARRTIMLISVASVLASLAAEEAVHVALDPRFWDAWKIVPLASSAVVFNSVKEFWLRPLTYNKTTVKYVPVATYTFVILSVTLTALMVPWFGMLGAAGAILMARILSSVLMLKLSLRHAPLDYPIFEIYGIAAAGILFSLVAYIPINGLILVKLSVASFLIVGVSFLLRSEALHLLKTLRVKSASVSA
jgi:O-antigen/teichoic acid export membrane protein